MQSRRFSHRSGCNSNRRRHRIFLLLRYLDRKAVKVSTEYGIALDSVDDELLHCHRFDRVPARSTLGTKHDRIRRVEDGRCTIRRLGTSRSGIFNHGLHHLGGNHTGLAVELARVDDFLLNDGHVPRVHLNTQITSRDHDTVRQTDDFLELVPHSRGFLELCHHLEL